MSVARANSIQWKAFFSTLRVKPLLTGAVQSLEDRVVNEMIETDAEKLIQEHTPKLPDGCVRAPVHLQMASLALSAQRTLHRLRVEQCQESNVLEVRQVVAGALGVHAPGDGADPTAVPILQISNQMNMLFAGGFFSADRRAKRLETMVQNFEKDLGLAFTLEPIEPSPSVQMKQCFYTSFLEAEGEVILCPIFQELHKSTFAGTAGYTFKPDPEGGIFLFEDS